MAQQANQPLPEGYQLENYRIASVLSCGGFSIVYLAYDENDQPVAIKEYLPSQLALRNQGDALPSIADENLATFRYGMRCFFEEGRALARLSHPNVVRVLNFFRANETVYMVMRYERGRTLQEHIHLRRGAIKEKFIRNVFALLLNGLREVHSNKLLHLDIKPANIYIRNDGTPVLIDFGAARQTLVEEGQRLTPMYTPGFAPPEQYKDRNLLGPWSDCYAIGASIFACLAGVAPQAADHRVEKDRYISAAKVWDGKYSRQLLQTIDWCLELDHMKRPQSVFGLQKVLLRERDPEVHSKGSFLQGLRAMWEEAARRMRFSIFQESRKGGRKANQDRTSYAYTRDALLMVVADGMGGHLHGEVASQIAVQLLTEAFQREAKPKLADPPGFLQKSILDAHLALIDYAKARNLVESPRTTCVACIVQDSTAYWAHAGDSRLYHVREGRIHAQTRDHSRVQMLVDQGRVREEAVAAHPDRNKIFNCVGATARPQVELSKPAPLRGDDALILCSDGLWGPLTSKLIMATLMKGDLMKTVPDLLDLAELRAGAECDNLSVVAMSWAGTHPKTVGEVSTQTLALDGVSTQLGDFSKADNSDLSDEEIERAIQEIREAIRKHTTQKP